MSAFSRALEEKDAEIAALKRQLAEAAKRHAETEKDACRWAEQVSTLRASVSTLTAALREARQHFAQDHASWRINDRIDAALAGKE